MKQQAIRRIKEAVKINTYWNDWIHKQYQKKNTKMLARKIEQLSMLDSIEDQQHLAAYRLEIENGSQQFTCYDINATNNRLYGICPSLFGSGQKDVYYPACEHGLILRDTNWDDTKLTVRGSWVTFGAFRKNILRRYGGNPIFMVGPYIQYAEDYYNAAQYYNKKAKLGRNLLVFPSHTTDISMKQVNTELLLAEIKRLENQFDSVTVCIFWWNINDELSLRLKAEGYQIVSAGFREDPNFLRRLRTIISLCDLAVGDGIGTHIGYCLSLGKPFQLLQTASEVIEKEGGLTTDFTQAQNHQIRLAFSSTMNIEKQQQLYKDYWGGDISLTREQLDKIYTINKQITKNARGFSSRYATEAEKILQEMQNSGDELGAQLLKEALE